jgi:hypothetical protein
VGAVYLMSDTSAFHIGDSIIIDGVNMARLRNSGALHLSEIVGGILHHDLERTNMRRDTVAKPRFRSVERIDHRHSVVMLSRIEVFRP